MTALPWASTGLDHKPRVVLPIADEACTNHPDEPVAPEYADAGLCQGCGDDHSQAIHEQRQTRGWENGDDIRTEPHVRFPFPTTTHEDI